MPGLPHTSRLRIHFEGHFQCRLATDPDPAREARGVSGYTFAIAQESDLDGVINLQADQIEDTDFRNSVPPYPEGGKRAFGVFIHRVVLLRCGCELALCMCEGEEWSHGQALLGGRVRLLNNPTYEIRNQIVADGMNRMAPVIAPFHMLVESRDGTIRLQRSDPLDPTDASRQIWEISDPRVYGRRIPTENLDSDEVRAAIGISDYRGHFQRRREWLTMQIASETEPVRLAALKTRLFAIETFGVPPENYAQATDQGLELGRMASRLGIQVTWDHEICGADPIITGHTQLGGRILGDPWRTRFWMGGWDGDVLRGFMRGWLDAPFETA